MKKIRSGIMVTFTCLLCSGFLVIALTLIGIFVDVTALYGLIFAGLLLLIGFLFYSIMVVEYDDETIRFKFFPAIKTKAIRKDDIKEVYIAHPVGRYQGYYVITINIDGRLGDTPPANWIYKSMCRSRGMNNLVTFAVPYERDIKRLFASHPSLIEKVTIQNC